jgi:outer membrane protein TolC
MQLANVRAVDVAAAAERIKVAVAVLEQARVLWLPSITFGVDYLYHAGPIQDVSNTIFNDSHSGLMVGAGSGIGNAGVISVNDAIFAPLAARQLARAPAMRTSRRRPTIRWLPSARPISTCSRPEGNLQEPSKP